MFSPHFPSVLNESNAHLKWTTVDCHMVQYVSNILKDDVGEYSVLINKDIFINWFIHM